MLQTIYMAYNNIKNVLMIFILLIFVYSIAGMELFGYKKGVDKDPKQLFVNGKKNFINYHANFTSFYVAFITLFRCTTGENWNGIMHDCYDINQIMSVIFFCSYEIITYFIF